MSSVFKTPKPTRLNTAFLTPSASSSDTDDSRSSKDSSKGGGDGSLSIVAEFDEIIRLVMQERNDKVEDAFIQLVRQTYEMYKSKWFPAIEECRRLQELLDTKTHDLRDLESKLSLARRMLDREKECTRKAAEERDSLKIQMNRVRQMLFRDVKSVFPDEARERLSFLKDESCCSSEDVPGLNGQLSAIQEVNTTGSLLSDLSYSRSEDDVNKSYVYKSWKKHRPSEGGAAEQPVKKRRSSGTKVVEINKSETVRATTTLTVTKEGPITATSVIESVPVESVTPKRKAAEMEAQQEAVRKWVRESPAQPASSGIRQHNFQPKTVVMPENCGPCAKRVRFGRNALKCKDCKALVHIECKDDLPLPCIPQLNTPTNRNLLGYIGDFTPTTPPLVPALIVHCLNEIERKGLNEIGIYRIPGAERDVKTLKERFLRGKGSPCLTQIDIHVICGTVKDFLRSLHEPLITYGLWKDFVQAINAPDEQDIAPGLYQAISELPQPNRDTLAFMILHLKRVAESTECKMPLDNLAKVFGPTIVGYSSAEPANDVVWEETRQQVAVMEKLLHLPTDYWASFLNVNSNLHVPSGRLQQTPSTDSLLRPNATRLFFTTPSNKQKKRRFFPTSTPPNKR